MNFDEYVRQLMTLDVSRDDHARFIHKQLVALKTTDKGLGMKIIVQQIINLKLLDLDNLNVKVS